MSRLVIEEPDMMIPSQRHLFDLPDDVAYLNCAYMAPLMHSVVEAGLRGVRRKARPWEIAAPDFFSDSAHARALFARILDARAQDVAIVPAASYGMAVAARNLPLGPGRTIVLLADQFPSNLYPWRAAAARAGAEIVTVDAPDGDLTGAVLAAIDERTAIAALPHCRWTDGALLDLESIGERVRAAGGALALDLTQSAGALTVDVARVRPAFAASACYKWLMGPYTLGFLYVDPEFQDGEPLEYGWSPRAGSEDFARLVDYRDEYAPGARRYDMGEMSNFHLMPMAIAALEQILAWGVENIAETLGARTAAIAERARAIGLGSQPAERRAGHFLGLQFAQGIPPGLLDTLARENVHVSVRGSSMRVTPHLYNTDADVDRLFAALEPVLAAAA